MVSSDAKPVAVRESKHIQILNGLKVLERTCGRAEEFEAELMGAPQQVEKNIKGTDRESTPSFSEVLNNAPGRLADINKRLNEFIDRLQEALY